MKKRLLIFICALFLYVTVNGQNAQFENITYKTKQITEEKTLLQKLFPSHTPKAEVPLERTITAKIILKGKVSLYEVDAYPGQSDLDYGTKPFFFIKTDEGTFPLLHREESANGYIVPQPYAGVLMYCLRDWNEREHYIKRAHYNEDGLKWIIENYSVKAK